MITQLPDSRAGLIPAHAGKTFLSCAPNSVPKAHPRSRGENVTQLAPGELSNGSSPLTRGKRRTHGPLHRAAGLIPAHAGKTRGSHTASMTAGAHPRSRGENAAYVGDVPNDTGSSPLTRGKQPTVILSVRVRGLIPAHAGKTDHPESSGLLPGAHPRSRGENTDSGSGRTVVTGSSPLTRGKLMAPPSRHTGGGLIPAHAGKTVDHDPRPVDDGAHPRSRGENPASYGGRGGLSGSSPLTRGKRSCGTHR